MVRSERQLIRCIGADLVLAIYSLKRLDKVAIVWIGRGSTGVRPRRIAQCFTPNVRRRGCEAVRKTTCGLDVQRVIRRILVVPLDVDGGVLRVRRQIVFRESIAS